MRKKLCGFFMALVMTAAVGENIIRAEEKNDTGDIVILNEIAWMGTVKSYSDEWIELKNETEKDIDLTEWKLKLIGKKTAEINLEGELKAGGYYLIERTDDDAVPGVQADLVSSFGSSGLSNSGMKIEIIDQEGKEIYAEDFSKEWPAGNNDTKQTMELSAEGTWRNSEKPDGTPKAKNSEPKAEPEPKCGNEITENNEECDDGNLEQGDGCNEECSVEEEYSQYVYINELLPDPEGSDGDGEWIEIVNLDEKRLNLRGWSLRDTTIQSNLNQGKTAKPFVFGDIFLEPGEYFILPYKLSKLSLNNSGGDKVYLFDPNGREAHLVQYAKIPQLGWSWARKDDGSFEWTSRPTARGKNIFDEKKIYAKEVYFNEILPNPKSIDKNNEWVELMNNSDQDVDLEDWFVENKGRRKFIIKGNIIKAHSFALVKLVNTTFTIGNTNENLKLKDPNGVIVSELSFSGAAGENVSYNFHQENVWKWSRFRTPGRDNRFNSPPKIKLRSEKSSFVRKKLIFDASKTKDKDGDKLKYKWDFGDGHFSYLEKTTHTYSKKGTYKVTLSINDGSEIVDKKFEVKINKYPKNTLKIIKILPDPEGSDTGKEMIEVENVGSKKLDLQDFYIASGRDEKHAVNHPIRASFLIAPGEKKIIEREYCAYSFLNGGGFVALRYPDKQNVDSISYSKEEVHEGVALIRDNQGKFVAEHLPRGNAEQVTALAEGTGLLSSKENILEQAIQQKTADEWSREVVAAVCYDERRQYCKSIRTISIENAIQKHRLWVAMSWGNF
jgi:cysteine-rich repeat protein